MLMLGKTRVVENPVLQVITSFKTPMFLKTVCRRFI